jgi:hypothetical protein
LAFQTAFCPSEAGWTLKNFSSGSAMAQSTRSGELKKNAELHPFHFSPVRTTNRQRARRAWQIFVLMATAPESNSPAAVRT